MVFNKHHYAKSCSLTKNSRKIVSNVTFNFLKKSYLHSYVLEDE